MPPEICIIMSSKYKYKYEYVKNHTDIILLHLPKKPKKKKCIHLWQRVLSQNTKVILPENSSAEDFFLPSKYTVDLSSLLKKATVFSATEIILQNKSALRNCKACLVDFKGKYLPLCHIMMKYCGTVEIYTLQKSRVTYYNREKEFFEKFGTLPVFCNALPHGCKLIVSPENNIIFVNEKRYSVNYKCVSEKIKIEQISEKQLATLNLIFCKFNDEICLFCNDEKIDVKNIKIQ